MSDVDLSRTSAYAYALPPELIAQVPAEQRERARLLDCSVDPPLDRHFAEFPQLLRAGDVLVINETQVVNARLRGTRAGGGAAEVFIVSPAGGGLFDLRADRWSALVRPGRRLRPGDRVHFGGAGSALIERVEPDGSRLVRFEPEGALPGIVSAYGEVPLPPYIERVGDNDPRAGRYQTVFARVPGSVAAPTASLHFTSEILARIAARGVHVIPLVLDVGLGTFKPVASERVEGHHMHEERYDIPAESAAAIERAKAQGGRVVAAGTTVVRALEAAAKATGRLQAGSGRTDLFIVPGFRFHVVDALLTNFHLPRSTLLMLVAALGGYERVLRSYQEAVARRYRFFSFGDAMFIERADT